MYVTLWECDDDTVLSENLIDRETNVTSGNSYIEVLICSNPEKDFKSESVVAEVYKKNSRGGLL